MTGLSKGELIEITRAVWQGEDGATAAKAIDEIIAGGDHLGIGTAVSSEFHFPGPSLVGYESIDSKPYWDFKILNETGPGAMPILRASSVTRTIIHTALGNDLNFPQQRLRTNNLLTPPGDFYHGAVCESEYDPEAGEYILKIHQGYKDETSIIPDDVVIAFADFVQKEDFTLRVRGEPGHYGSLHVHERIGSLPISMGDVRANMAASAIRYFTYNPLCVPSPDSNQVR